MLKYFKRLFFAKFDRYSIKWNFLLIGLYLIAIILHLWIQSYQIAGWIFLCCFFLITTTICQYEFLEQKKETETVIQNASEIIKRVTQEKMVFREAYKKVSGIIEIPLKIPEND